MSMPVVRRMFGSAIGAGIILTFVLGGGVTQAQQTAARPPAAAPSAQKVDADYTKRIIDNTPDKRILTELVDHMPLPNDPNVPSPLKFLGYVPGENGQLTYHKDIIRYYQALEKASKR